ncbi:MAG TPA: hypothetical protein VIO36_13845 [Anaerolineaceae bacterium]
MKQERNNRNTAQFSQEYSRILSAAVINARFRQALLNNPVQAVTTGYWGEKFQLGSEERNHLASIRATSLAEFATQLASPASRAGMAAACD